MFRTALGDYRRVVVVAMTMLVAMLMMLAGANPVGAKFAGFPVGHDPIAFEKDGDIWVAGPMHLANLTPNTADSNDVGPAVSPDGRYVAFAGDRDGEDYEIYVANVFTGEVEQVTDNAADDRDPVWSPDGQWISYQSSHYASPTHSGVFSAKVLDTLGS
jgi:dipeptidyl aminopeptidase/acylaminoacyl peptidase